MGQGLSGATSSQSNAETMLGYAADFLLRLHDRQQKGQTPLPRGKEAFNPPGHPSRADTWRHEFILDLFGFLCAVRASREFISLALSAPPVTDPHVAFCCVLANACIHERIVGVSPNYNVLGKSHGTWSYNYNSQTFRSDAAALFAALPNVPGTSNPGSVIDIARKSIGELCGFAAQNPILADRLARVLESTAVISVPKRKRWPFPFRQNPSSF